MCSPTRPVYRISFKSAAEGLNTLDEIGHVFIEDLEGVLNANRGRYDALRATELDLENLLARCRNLIAETSRKSI